MNKPIAVSVGSEEDRMYFYGYQYAAETFASYPSIVQINLRVAKQAIMNGDNSPWQRGNADGLLSAFGY